MSRRFVTATPRPTGQRGERQADTSGPAPQPTTTTTSGDFRIWETNPPQVSQLRAGGDVPDGPDEIFDGGSCGPTSISVEAVVVDQSTIRAVTLHWQFVGSTGIVAGSSRMEAAVGRASADRYTGRFGPFAGDTIPSGTSVVVRWWVEAIDKNGNVGRADAPDGSGELEEDDERIRLTDCPG